MIKQMQHQKHLCHPELHSCFALVSRKQIKQHHHASIAILSMLAHSDGFRKCGLFVCLHGHEICTVATICTTF